MRRLVGDMRGWCDGSLCCKSLSQACLKRLEKNLIETVPTALNNLPSLARTYQGSSNTAGDFDLGLIERYNQSLEFGHIDLV